MPTTTVLPGRLASLARRTGVAPRYAATVLFAGACYASLLGLVVAPLIGTLRVGRPEPVAAAVRGPVVATEAARGFTVPVDDPLLVNEQVYQLLVAQAPPAPHPPVVEPAAPASAERSTLASVAAGPAAPEAVAPQPVAGVVAEVKAPPAIPAQKASLAVDGRTAESPRAGPEPFVGVWSASAGACSARPSRGGYLLATIDEAGAWAGTTRCSFRDKRRTADGWSFEARCASPRERWSTRVRLRMDGARLKWASPRGVETYTRCERRLLTAQAS